MQPGRCLLPIAAVLALAACENGHWVGLRSISGWNPRIAGWNPNFGSSRSYHGGHARPVPRTEDAASTTPAPASPGDSEGSSSVESQSSLVGLDESETARRLGPPHETRDKAPGKSWTYRGSGCTLELSLYPDVATHTYRTLSYRVQGSDASGNERTCVNRLQSHAQGG